MQNLIIVNEKCLIRESGELDNTIIAFSTDNGGVPYAGALNYPLKYKYFEFTLNKSEKSAKP